MPAKRGSTPKTVFILGGYGTTGALIADLLLAATDVRLIVAGRNAGKAEVLCDRLNSRYPGERAAAMFADASDPSTLEPGFRRADLAVIASSTSKWAASVARAAMAVGIDALDLQYSTAKLTALRALEKDIEAAGCCFITDGGFHPGLPAAMIRYGANRFDRLERAEVAGLARIDWRKLSLSPATTEEFVLELREFQPLTYRGGRWVKSWWKGYTQFDFGPEFGSRWCAPMFLEELRCLPERIPSLERTGFFMAGFHWLVDTFIMPIGWAALTLRPERAAKPVGELMDRALRRTSAPPYGTVLVLRASGVKDGHSSRLRVTVSHPDGYLLTAAAVVASLQQVLDGTIRQPGLWLQGAVVDPERLLADLERFAVAVDIRTEPDER